MKLRTYNATSLPQALQQVRDELGDDAVILSTQEDESGGVRVTAAIEDQPMDSLDFEPGDSATAMIDEIRAVMDFHRVPRTLADRILAQAAGLAADSPDLALAGALDAELVFGEPGMNLPGRTIMLAGPPGAGKTAAAVKLCALAKLDERRCALVTMDEQKAGGLARISAFAETLGVSLKAADDPAALHAVMGETRDCDLVFVDTAGINPFNPAELAELRIAKEASEAQMILVLPAGGDALDSAETAVAFADAGAAGLILSKTDIARRLGGCLAAAQASGLKLMAAGVSPTIGDGLLPLNPVSFARLLAAEAVETPLPLRATGTDS